METDNNEQEIFLTNSVGINGTFYVLLKNDFESQIPENIRDISFDKSQHLLSVFDGQYTKEKEGFRFSDRIIEHQQGVLIPFDSIVRLMDDEGKTIWEP